MSTQLIEEANALIRPWFFGIRASQANYRLAMKKFHMAGTYLTCDKNWIKASEAYSNAAECARQIDEIIFYIDNKVLAFRALHAKHGLYRALFEEVYKFVDSLEALDPVWCVKYMDAILQLVKLFDDGSRWNGSVRLLVRAEAMCIRFNLPILRETFEKMRRGRDDIWDTLE